MPMCDWSSDVCSSDLLGLSGMKGTAAGRAWQGGHQRELGWLRAQHHLAWPRGFREHQSRSPAAYPGPLGPRAEGTYRSPLPDTRSQLLSPTCVFGGFGETCAPCVGVSPASRGSSSRSWPRLVPRFPLHGPTHHRAAVTVMVIFIPPSGQPTPVFLPEESQGGGSLVGCRLWGRTSEQ